ncbi:hypothetical protein [Salinisphaera orenii]|uniref:hypothetical protein n=1 Tax=Salinisphaera orenii TaxID=856731 RepID=UPI0013A64CE2
MNFLVTGCGRSGTNYVADRLKSSGVNCGHERVFSVTGPLDNADDFEGDASWFAAPFISARYSRLKVLHIVREPREVVDSFHRIGLCSDRRFRHFSGGKNVASTIFRFNLNFPKIRDRLDYVNAHRQLLAEYTTCWEVPDEFNRLCEYWYQWNKLIENNVKQSYCSYLRVRLDEIDDCWVEIENFLETDKKVIAGHPTNKKTRYKAMRKFSQTLPDKVVNLAKKYGLEGCDN